MKKFFENVLFRLRLFRQDVKGTLSVETVIIFPMLGWAYIAMFIYFDAFKAQTINLKAAYTISDLLSREINPVNMDYLNGMNKVYDYLTYSSDPTWIRVTVVKWSNDDNAFHVQWSKATKSRPSITDDTIALISNQIPTMPESDSVIVVETNMTYEPAFNVGLSSFSMKNLVVTRPRFAPQLLWDPNA